MLVFGHYSLCAKLPAPELSLYFQVLLGWNVLEEAECLMSPIQVTLEDLALESLLHLTTDMVRETMWLLADGNLDTEAKCSLYVHPIPF